MNPQPDTLVFPNLRCSRCHQPPDKIEQKSGDRCPCGGKWEKRNKNIIAQKPYQDQTLLDAAFYQFWYMTRDEHSMLDTLKRLARKSLAVSDKPLSESDISKLEMENLSPSYEYWTCALLENLKIGHQRHRPRNDQPPSVVLRINGEDRLIDGANRLNCKIAKKMGHGIIILEVKDSDQTASAVR